MLKKQRSKILKCKDRFSSQLQKFLKIKKEFFKISRDLEQNIDEVGRKVAPIQRARFLKYVDKIKHRKELNLFELWGVKSKKSDFISDKLLENFDDKNENTYTMLKKRDKKRMLGEAESKIMAALQKNKKIFENNHGPQSAIKEESAQEDASEKVRNYYYNKFHFN